VEVNIEQIIQLVTKHVIRDLQNRGIKIKEGSVSFSNPHVLKTKSERVDMSRYKTPILTENHIRRLHELTGEVVVPEGTVITPKAKEMIKDRHIVIRNL
jgi:hypothetical protein